MNKRAAVGKVEQVKGTYDANPYAAVVKTECRDLKLLDC